MSKRSAGFLPQRDEEDDSSSINESHSEESGAEAESSSSDEKSSSSSSSGSGSDEDAKGDPSTEKADKDEKEPKEGIIAKAVDSLELIRKKKKEKERKAKIDSHQEFLVKIAELTRGISVPTIPIDMRKFKTLGAGKSTTTDTDKKEDKDKVTSSSSSSSTSSSGGESDVEVADEDRSCVTTYRRHHDDTTAKSKSNMDDSSSSCQCQSSTSIPGSSDEGDVDTDEDEASNVPMLRKCKSKKSLVRIRSINRRRGVSQASINQLTANILRGMISFKKREGKVPKKSPIVRAELADDAEPITYTGNDQIVYEENVKRKAIELDESIHVLGYQKRTLVTRVGESLAGHYGETFRPNPISEDIPWADRLPGKSILKVGFLGQKSKSKKRKSSRKRSSSRKK